MSTLLDHLTAVHSGGFGKFVLSADAQGCEHHFMMPEDLQRGAVRIAISESFRDKPLWCSIARFRGEKRGKANLVGLSAISVIIALKSPKDSAKVVVELIERLALGSPSVIDRGEAMEFQWLHNHLPAVAAPRWQAVGKEIVGRFRRAGYSAKAARSTGLSRFAGPDVELLIHGARADFDALCSSFLPFSQKVLQQRRVEAERLAQGARAARLWDNRLCDIRNWVRRIWPHGIPPGHRNDVIWLVANAIAWSVADPDAIPGEIRAIALEMAPTATEGQIAIWTSSVLKRLVSDSGGRKNLYKFKDEALAAELTAGLGITARNEWEAVTATSLSERQRRRQVLAAQARNRKSDAPRRKAIRLRKSGNTIREIAAKLGFSKSTVAGWLKQK